jgi:hypothetical protein
MEIEKNKGNRTIGSIHNAQEGSGRSRKAREQGASQSMSESRCQLAPNDAFAKRAESHRLVFMPKGLLTSRETNFKRDANVLSVLFLFLRFAGLLEIEVQHAMSGFWGTTAPGFEGCARPTVVADLPSCFIRPLRSTILLKLAIS